MSHNVLRLGCSAGFGTLKVLLSRTEAKPFLFFQIYKKIKNKNGFCGLFYKKFNKPETPHCAKPMLPAAPIHGFL
jgi:hypothetical protein